MKYLLFVLLLTGFTIQLRAASENDDDKGKTPVKLPLGTTVAANIAYDQYPATVLDVLQPARTGDELRPAVIFIHGGGWYKRSKEFAVPYLLPYLEHGFVVCNVEYRLAKAAPAPAAVEDIFAAARWLFAHAADYHIDSRKIVVAGFSSGGHLSLLAGMAPESARFGPPQKFAAIIDYYGPTQVRFALEIKYVGALAWLPQQEGREQLIERVTPSNYVHTGVPPVCILHNRNDPLVPFTQSESLFKALRAVGVDCELHDFDEPPKHGLTDADWPVAQSCAIAFLEKRGIAFSKHDVKPQE
jgi:acetyl esterase/lipase